MSFVLGIYDLTAYLLPGFIYILLINKLLRLFNLQYLQIADIQTGWVWMGLAIAAFFLGFLSIVILEQFWFFKHWPKSEEGLIRVKNRHPDLKISFKEDDWKELYPIMKQRLGSNAATVLEHPERFNAFSMMARNLVGVFSCGVIIQITDLIINGLDAFQLILSIVFFILAIISYKTFIWYWHRCVERLFGHVLAYGPNFESYLANDQPNWNPLEFTENVKGKTTNK